MAKPKADPFSRVSPDARDSVRNTTIRRVAAVKEAQTVAANRALAKPQLNTKPDGLLFSQQSGIKQAMEAGGPRSPYSGNPLKPTKGRRR